MSCRGEVTQCHVLLSVLLISSIPSRAHTIVTVLHERSARSFRPLPLLVVVLHCLCSCRMQSASMSHPFDQVQLKQSCSVDVFGHRHQTLSLPALSRASKYSQGKERLSTLVLLVILAKKCGPQRVFEGVLLHLSKCIPKC